MRRRSPESAREQYRRRGIRIQGRPACQAVTFSTAPYRFRPQTGTPSGNRDDRLCPLDHTQPRDPSWVGLRGFEPMASSVRVISGSPPCRPAFPRSLPTVAGKVMWRGHRHVWCRSSSRRDDRARSVRTVSGWSGCRVDWSRVRTTARWIAVGWRPRKWPAVVTQFVTHPGG